MRATIPDETAAAIRLQRNRTDQRQEDLRARGLARRTDTERLADALGWFSVVAGLTALVAPRAVAGMLAVGGRGASGLVVRLVGLRETATGVGILSSRRPAGWLWARVAGDVMDLALLGVALRSPRPGRGRAGATALAVGGVTALDWLAARELSRRDSAAPARPSGHAVVARKSVTVNEPAEPLYRFWRDVTNLPRFMHHLEAVHPAGDGRSRWRARGPAGMRVEWDAELVDDRPNQLIAWRSVPGASLQHAGTVRFESVPGGRGTTVTVELEYTPPGGVLGARVARLLGQAPEQQLQEDLRRFKQLMETGEIVVSEGVLLGAAQSIPTRRPAVATAGGQR